MVPLAELELRTQRVRGIRLQLLAWSLLLSVLQLLPGPLQFRFQLFGPFLLRVSPLPRLVQSFPPR
jgi:hypothetical protein